MMLKDITITIDDLITGEKFYDLADQIYSPNIKPEFEDYNKLNNTFHIKNLKKNKTNIIYTHTLYVKHLFNIIKDLDFKFKIITHNSDINIDNSFIIPNNVFKWYSQNVNCNDEKLFSIPIGLENNRWFKEINKKQKMLDIIKTDKNIKNLVYVNHNISTNPEERRDPYEILSGKSFATVEQGSNGQNFDKYLDNIYNHKFVICPNGNGIDTHRLWECLYLNTIPIVKMNFNNLFYKDLPIYFVEKWSDLNEQKLIEAYKLIKDYPCWNYKKLTFAYWRFQICQLL